MASTISFFGRRTLASVWQRPALISSIAQRNYSTKKEEGTEPPSESPAVENNGRKSWLSRLLPVRTVDPGQESHSSLLSDKDTVYELQFHCVKPECMQQYLVEFETFVDTVHEKKTGAQLAGSFTVEIGDQDEAIHLWKFPGGYPVLNAAREIYRHDPEFIEFRLNRNKMLRSRKNQILLAFSFWGDVQPRDGKHIYELRSYTLKPGTMIEWGNNWAKGIRFRQEKEEAVCGFFSHIGDLYEAHHLWAYESLQDRKRIRENVWDKEGWNSVISNTVPLIRHMTARVLIPTPFSPLQ